MAYKNSYRLETKAFSKGWVLIGVLGTIILGLTVAIALDKQQPEQSNLAQNLAKHPRNTGSTGDTPVRSLALPLAKISVELAPPVIIERNVTITPGDTLISAIMRSGADRTTAQAAVDALSKSYNPRRLRPGQTLKLLFKQKIQSTKAHPTLVQLAFYPSVDKEIRISLKDKGGFKSETINQPLSVQLYRAEGSIDDSLYLAAKRAGVPPPVIVYLIRIYSFDVDFQRDIQRGDNFELLFEVFYNKRDEFAKFGAIKYAKLRVRETELPLYRFVMPDGKSDYFNNDGHSVRKALMKTPIDGARLTSRFGQRKHPILGYKKMHRGIDFGAPRGTPVMAAGNGIVEVAGWNGHYGRYLRIRHNSRYKTAYAHLSKFHRNIRTGKRVRQGQIIAFVGSTGRSTGPHLHYEILVNNKRINPLRLKLPSGKKLKGRELSQFRKIRDKTKRMYAGSPAITQMSKNN